MLLIRFFLYCIRIALVITIYATLICLYKYKNPGVNFQSKISIHECIYRSWHEILHIDNFTINYITNAPSDCLNPNFPAIHIVSDQEYNGWIHIVYTDSPEYPKGYFIDAHKAIHPFYTLEKDFYDAPYWNSTLLKKPLTFWHGHAYAVIIDQCTRTMQYVNGIKWGFELPWFRFSPLAIMPSKLSRECWQQDMQAILAEKNYEWSLE